MRRIDLRKKPRRLETISVGDVLIFPGREETVEQVNTHAGSLLTKTIVKSEDRNFPFKEQLILYKHIGRVGPSSTGHVYWGIKRTT